MGSRHGLGRSNAASSITPCPAVIDQFFKEQLHYCKQTKKSNDKEPFIVTYSKGLSYPDSPVFESLAGQQYLSYIKIDLYNGIILDDWFEIRNNIKRFDRVWEPIRTYAELLDAVGENKDIEWLFKWHLNIVHMTREYFKGGWLFRRKRRENLEATKDKYIVLNRKGFTNVLENAKPDNVKFLGNGKVEPK